MAVSIEMVLPGLAGWWLDNKIGWNVFTGTGFILGLIGGVTHLIVMTRPTRELTVKTERSESKKEVVSRTVESKGKDHD